jgi:hypothetical protein
MANEITLQSEGRLHPVDENLRPIKVGGKSTAIETAQNGNGARISGDLEATGDIKATDAILKTVITDSIKGQDVTIRDTADLTIDASGDIGLDADGGNIRFLDGGVTYLNFQVDGSNDEMSVAGSLAIVTTADIALDAVGDITLDSADGNFITKKSGTEFSAANSSYAGMILGYTEMAYGTAFGRYDATTSFVVINDNYDHGDGAEDHFLGVTFVVPPSNKVEIEVHLPYISGADGTLHLGLATATDATTLKAKFEVVAWDVDESDLVQVIQKWVIDGSDSGMEGGAWSAGESKTLYCMTKETTAGARIFWGDGFVNYGDMTMKATALPATIGDGT